MDNPKTYWDTFDGFYQMGPQKHRIYLLDLLKEKGVKSIFDVGCGTGPIWGIIKDNREKYDFTYLGTDYSEGMIEICRKEFPECKWNVEDARALKQLDNSFDCVLLMHCLDHVDDYKVVIKEAARVASKYVCIVLWRPFIQDRRNNLNDRNMYGKEEGEEPWEDTHFQEYSRELLEEAFEQSGLLVAHIAKSENINEAGKTNFLWLLKNDKI